MPYSPLTVSLMDVLLQIGALCSLAAMIATTMIVGRATMRFFELRFPDPISTIVWQGAVGLLICGNLFAYLGLVDLLYPSVVVGFTVGVNLLACVRIFWSQARGIAEADEFAVNPAAAPAGDVAPVLRGLLFMGAAVALASSLLGGLAPPTAGDALCYHLELPKRYLQDHALTHYPHSDNSTYPLLAEMWFLWGLAVEGPVAAQLMHWYCGVLLAGAAYVLALPILGRPASLVAAAVAMLTPGINNQMTAPLNDVALALFTALAVAAGLDGLRSSIRSRCLLAGAMLGGALGVKYTALVFVAACGGLIVSAAWWTPERRRFLLKSSLSASAVSLLVAAPWYARSVYYHGDPIYPFLSGAGGQTGASPTTPIEGLSAVQPQTFPKSKTPLGRSPTVLLTAPWQFTMMPERFGGRSHQLGPLFLMLLPLVVLMPVGRRTAVMPLLLVAVTYGGLCVLLRQNVRFIFPLVPPLSVVVAGVLALISAWGVRPRRIATCCCAAVALLLFAVPVARMRDQAAVALGIESRESFLVRREPTAKAAEWANAQLPPDAHLLSQEQRAFYFDARLTRERIYRRTHDYRARAAIEGTTLGETLLMQGFTHLLLAEGEGSNPASYDDTLSRAVERELREHPQRAPVLLAEFHSTADGLGRRYRLLSLR